jgi:hypothetical protein
MRISVTIREDEGSFYASVNSGDATPYEYQGASPDEALGYLVRELDTFPLTIVSIDRPYNNSEENP